MQVHTLYVRTGRLGPTWNVDDIEEGQALAEEHGYTVHGREGNTLLVTL